MNFATSAHHVHRTTGPGKCAFSLFAGRRTPHPEFHLLQHMYLEEALERAPRACTYACVCGACVRTRASSHGHGHGACTCRYFEEALGGIPSSSLMAGRVLGASGDAGSTDDVVRAAAGLASTVRVVVARAEAVTDMDAVATGAGSACCDLSRRVTGDAPPPRLSSNSSSS